MKTVLLLQGDPAALERHTAALRFKGYDVVTAMSVEEAISRFISAGRRFHLFIADLRLPETSGLRVARLLRGKCRRLKTILTSPYPRAMWTREENEDLERLDGAVSVVVMPCSPESLASTVEATIGPLEAERQPIFAAAHV